MLLRTKAGRRAPLPCVKADVDGCKHHCCCWAWTSCCTANTSGGVGQLLWLPAGDDTSDAWSVFSVSFGAPRSSAPPGARSSRSCGSFSVPLWGSQNGIAGFFLLKCCCWCCMVINDMVIPPIGSSRSAGLQVGTEGPEWHRLPASELQRSYSLQFALLAVSLVYLGVFWLMESLCSVWNCFCAIKCHNWR